MYVCFDLVSKLYNDFKNLGQMYLTENAALLINETPLDEKKVTVVADKGMHN